jgi:hypothetical protein
VWGLISGGNFNNKFERAEMKIPTWEEAIDGIADSRFTTLAYNAIHVRTGARIMYDRLFSMLNDNSRLIEAQVMRLGRERAKEMAEELYDEHRDGGVGAQRERVFECGDEAYRLIVTVFWEAINSRSFNYSIVGKDFDRSEYGVKF